MSNPVSTWIGKWQILPYQNLNIYMNTYSTFFAFINWRLEGTRFSARKYIFEVKYMICTKILSSFFAHTHFFYNQFSCPLFVRFCLVILNIQNKTRHWSFHIFWPYLQRKVYSTNVMLDDWLVMKMSYSTEVVCWFLLKEDNCFG